MKHPRLHHGLTNFVGWSGSRGSRYLELEGHWSVAGVDIVPHVGVQKVPGRADLDGMDYSLTVSRSFQNVLLSAALVKDAGGPQNYNYFARIGGTDYDGPDLAAPATIWTMTPASQLWNASPSTSGAWSQAELNAAEFGIRSRA